MKMRFIAVLILPVILTACSGLFDPEQDMYSYKSYDQEGTLVVTGWLYIDNLQADEITGSWRLKSIAPAAVTGINAESGLIQGNRNDGQIILDLHPQLKDHNLLLRGALDNNVFQGEWILIGFAGSLSQGSFQAVRYY